MFLNNMEETSNTSAKRVRKKSAKLKEMEESEAFERRVFKSPPKGNSAATSVKVTSPPVRKKPKKSQPASVLSEVPTVKPEPETPEPGGFPLKIHLPSPPVKRPPVTMPVTPKTPLTAGTDDKVVKKKIKNKKLKSEKDPKFTSEPMLVSSTDSEMFPTVTVKKQPDSGLKLKLCLNSQTEETCETSDFKSDDEQPAIWPVKEVTNSRGNETQCVVKLKKKKKPQKNKDDINGDNSQKLKPEVPPSPEKDMDFANHEGDLIIDIDAKSNRKDKSSKKAKKTIKSEIKEELPGPNVSVKSELSDNGLVKEEKPKTGVRPVNLYSNTEAMALKLKTSFEKKVTGASKDKDKLKKKKFRRSGPTAYTMFCNNYRPKVIAENPGSADFAQTSKRLGEIWQCLPAKEKMFWKRKARQRLNRMKKLADVSGGAAKSNLSGPDLLQSVKSASTPSANNKLGLGRRPGKFGPRTKLTAAEAAEVASSSVLGQLLTSDLSEGGQATTAVRPDNTTPCKPIDVAAHLKLLGDSLHTIGSRLQQHKGPIAVQGSLSVLLDTSICAMGTLMCLTNQVPELKKIPNSIHSENLDNIAYIMPGIG